MKKLSYLFVSVLALILLFIGFIVFRTWSIENDAEKISKRENINNLSHSPFKSLKIMTQDKVSYYYFAPTKSNEAFYHENLPVSLYETTKNKKQYIFIKPEFIPTPLKGISQVKIHKVVYQPNLMSLKKVSDQVISDYHVKHNFQPFYLSELVSGHLDDINKVVSKTYPDKSFDISQYSKLNERDRIISDNYQLKMKDLVLKDNIILPVKELFNVVDANYLTGQLKTDYLDYQEKKKAEEAALHPKKLVALTFDDGPNPLTTPQVLSTLQRYQDKATFFMLGSKVTGNEAIVKSIVDSGSEIGNHSWDHPDLTKIPIQDVKTQIDNTNTVIEKVIGKKPTYLRPPYGATNDRIEKTSGMRQILWTVDTRDWENHNTEKMMANIKGQLHPGGIILMHDVHQTSLQALPTILDYLKKEGYQCVTLSELLGQH
ncbi:polysaccharide deacetylase family protein [Streptococcus hongkongensis]|nr:deacetylase [Streptococcus uberis]